jgi:cell division protein FtsW
MHKLGMILFFGGAGLMIVMNFLPESIVPVIGGASRWISILGFSVAPVEFFKIGFVYFISWSLSRKIEPDHQHPFKTELFILAPHILIFVVSLVLIAVLQKDLGQSVILAGTFIVLTSLGGASRKFIIHFMNTLAILFIIFILTFSHRTERIQSWWLMAKEWLPEWLTNIIGDSNGAEPYQVARALDAINNGGFWGVGLGNGVFKLGFLAEVHTDFVMPGIVEEMGIFSLIVIFALFLIIFQRILKIANRSEYRRFFLFNIGVALLFGLAIIINTYGSVGLIPMKGIPIPFLSYGGSSMIALSVGIGMVLMTSKNSETDQNYESADTSQYMGRGNGRETQNYRTSYSSQNESYTSGYKDYSQDYKNYDEYSRDSSFSKRDFNDPNSNWGRDKREF